MQAEEGGRDPRGAPRRPQPPAQGGHQPHVEQVEGEADEALRQRAGPQDLAGHVGEQREGAIEVAGGVVEGAPDVHGDEPPEVVERRGVRDLADVVPDPAAAQGRQVGRRGGREDDEREASSGTDLSAVDHPGGGLTQVRQSAAAPRK